MSTSNAVQYNDNMRGVLYKNKQKTEPKHPGARGRAKIGGIWYWMSSWTQHAKTSGERYQSVAFTEMTEEEVQKYITNTNPPQETNNQSVVQSSNQPPQNNQGHQEHNPDGSVRPSNEPPKDFDDDIPF